MLAPDGFDAAIERWRMNGVWAELQPPETYTTPEWRQYLERNALEDYCLDRRKTGSFLETEYRNVSTILKEIGLN